MKVYESILDIFEDGIISPTEIVVIWGKRGSGKSSLAGFFMSEFMRPKIAKNDVRTSQEICSMLRDAGYSLHPPTDHTVFCDTYFESKGFMKKKNVAYSFNAIDFGLPNQIHPTSLLCPCGRYFFDEAQDLFDSHISALPTFVTKAIELSRQLKLFLAIISQRPIRIHKDIRDLSVFIEVKKMTHKYNKYGRILYSEWECNIIYDNAVLEQYLNSKDASLVDKKLKFRYNGNIFKCYDTNYFMPMFFRGFENRDFVLEKSARTQFTSEFFESYLKNRVIDIPETYRGKKPKEKNKKE